MQFADFWDEDLQAHMSVLQGCVVGALDHEDHMNAPGVVGMVLFFQANFKNVNEDDVARIWQRHAWPTNYSFTMEEVLTLGAELGLFNFRSVEESDVSKFPSSLEDLKAVCVVNEKIDRGSLDILEGMQDLAAEEMKAMQYEVQFVRKMEYVQVHSYIADKFERYMSTCPLTKAIPKKV